jgi:hypothetical protein
MSHKKVHEAAHIAYIALYGLLIVFSIVFYDRANLEILLYSGIILGSGIILLVLAGQCRKGEETLVDRGNSDYFAVLCCCGGREKECGKVWQCIQKLYEKSSESKSDGRNCKANTQKDERR